MLDVLLTLGIATGMFVLLMVFVAYCVMPILDWLLP